MEAGKPANLKTPLPGGINLFSLEMSVNQMNTMNTNVTCLFYRQINGVRTLFDDYSYVKRKVEGFQGNRNLQLVEVLKARIKILEEELLQYRGMIDRMVSQRTEMLVRRISILECCNSRLGENYHKTHRMYLDLVNAQSNEEGIYQRVQGSEINLPDKSHH